MGRYYYEDGRWPWRPDSLLKRFLGKQIPRFARNDRGRLDKATTGRPSYAKATEGKSARRALDLGMGYGRNALWLAARGYQVEGWERDRRYVAEAKREAARRGLQLHARRVDFTHLRPAGSGGRARAGFCGPYDVIVISLALHQVRRSAALRVLRWSCQVLAPGGRLFLMVKLTRDRHFQRAQATPSWKRVRGEKNTFLRPQRLVRGYFHPGRPRRRRIILSALTSGEVKQTLRGLEIRHYREGVLRSDWEEPQPVTHHVAEVVAQKTKIEERKSKLAGKRGSV